MQYSYVSIQDFKKLEEKVNKLLVVHELDSLLTAKEKLIMEETREDLKNKRKDKFIGIDQL